MGINGIENKDVIGEAIEQLRNMVDFGVNEADEQKIREKYDAKIQAKLESGKRLSAKEMQYLKKYNPVLYAHAKRIEAKRRSVEEQLRHAKSKQEVCEIQDLAIGTINKNDPVRKYMIAAVQETIKAFKETQDYKKLPAVEEEGKKSGTNKIRNDSDDEEDEGKFSITYEVSEGTYQVAFMDTGSNAVKGFTAIS